MFGGYEVLKAAVITSYIFWDIPSYSPVKVNSDFEGIYHLHFQSFLLGLLFNLED
jgi:hypothetical protein